MLYYLDSNIIIYAVEGLPALQLRARNHIAVLDAAGSRFVVGDLSLTECLVILFRAGNGPLVLDYDRFFMGPHLAVCSMTAAIHRRAGMIRAVHKHRLADSLHLASAVEFRCDRFLTNDLNLLGFPDIVVEQLPRSQRPSVVG